jgi:anti-anti-sigma factor
MTEQSILQIQENENAVVVTIQCSEFDHDTTAQLRAEIDGVIAPTSTLPLLLDLSNVTFMPSMTLGALIELANRCKTQQRRLVLVGVTPSVQDVFKISALTNFFEIRDCVEDVV